MKLNHLFLTGLLVAGVGVTAVAVAQQAPTAQTAPAPGHHHGMMAGLRGVNLTDQQRSQIKTLMENYRQAHPKGSQPSEQDRKALRASVMNVLTPDQQTQFKANMQQMRQQRAQMQQQQQQQPQPEATPN